MVKRGKKKLKKRTPKSGAKWFILTGMAVFFAVSFFYLWQRDKVRKMLMEEQRYRVEIQRLIEGNRRLELEIANMCSLENLKNTITDPDFGFPEPERVKHLHWLDNDDRQDEKLFDRAVELVLDWLKEGLDVNKTSLADSL